MNEDLINVRMLTPFRKFIMSVGEIPSAYMDSMTYYEMLNWFCNYLQNEVIPSVNNNASAVTQLQNLYNELKEYVDNYFDNLDVQEEINNKLDDMVEGGQLQEIVADYLNSKAIFGFDNVNSMKNATNLINGSYARTLGYYSKNDGGGALYKIRNITNDDIVDDMFIIEMSDDNLIGELIVGDEINIKQLGAQESENDSNDIKIILEKVFNKYNKIIIPNGTYYLSKFEYSFYGERNIMLEGQGNTNLFVKDGIFFTGLENSSYNNRILKISVNNINFYGSRNISEKRGIGLSFNWFGECYINNCYFRRLNYGIKCLNGSEMVIKNCISLGNNYGIYLCCDYTNQNCDLDAVSLYDCYISNNLHNVLLDSVRGTSLLNCVISNSRESESYGLEILNSYGSTVNINVLNCEFENNTNNPSLLSGKSNENFVGCSLLNILNCKFVCYGEKTIQLNNGVYFNFTSSIISTEFLKLISIGVNATRLQINLKDCYRFLSSYIEDNRLNYYGAKKFNDMKRLNFFPSTKHGVTEYVASVPPTYDTSSKTIKFTNSGFIAYNIKEKNYIPQNGLQCVIIGKNLNHIFGVINGVETDLGKFVVQTLNNEYEVINIVAQQENITQLRFKFSNNAEILRIEIYGECPNELPKCPFTSITNQNFIGEPDVGDTISLTQANEKTLYSWNGSSYV